MIKELSDLFNNFVRILNRRCPVDSSVIVPPGEQLNGLCYYFGEFFVGGLWYSGFKNFNYFLKCLLC